MSFKPVKATEEDRQSQTYRRQLTNSGIILVVWLENFHLDITITHEATSFLLRLAATASSNTTTHSF